MAKTRILMVNLPRFLGDVMSAIVAGHSGLEIVGQSGVDDMLAAISTLRPDVVLLGNDTGQADGPLASLKTRYPLLRVVAIDAGGRTATAHEPGAAARAVAEVSPEMLLDMLRGVRG